MTKKIILVFALTVTLVFGSCVFVGCDNNSGKNGDSAKTEFYVSGGIVTDSESFAPSGVSAKEKTVEDQVDDIVYEIIDLDSDRSGRSAPIDDSVKYVYGNDYTVVTGGSSVVEEGGGKKSYIATTYNTMLVNSDGSDPFPYGTISCKVKSLNTCDTGIVFGYSSDNPGSFEGKGVYYYFYFLGLNGYSYLGQVYDGAWRAIKGVKLPTAVDETRYYDLKIVFKGQKILCYMDGELSLAVKDENVLTGTGYGMRMGAAGASVKDFSVTNEYLYY